MEFTITGLEGPHATPWMEDRNGSGKLIRTLCVPDGMNVEETRRILKEGELARE
jgi:hypothetical protein